MHLCIPIPHLFGTEKSVPYNAPSGFPSGSRQISPIFDNPKPSPLGKGFAPVKDFPLRGSWQKSLIFG